jgi:hypothetical protein
MGGLMTHRLGVFNAAPSGPAANDVWFTDSEASEQSTTSATLVDAFTTTILANQQQASETYLGFWSAEFRGDASASLDVQLTKNGSAYYTASTIANAQSAPSGSSKAMGGMFIHAAGGTPADVTYAIQYLSNGSTSSYAKNARISWFKLGPDDVQTTALGTQTRNAITHAAMASLNFTPPSAGDYIILASFVLGNSSATASAFVQMTDGTTTTPEFNFYGGSDGATEHSGIIPLKLTGISGSKTINFNLRSSTTGNTITIEGIVLVAIRLDRFAAAPIQIMGSSSAGADTTYTVATSQTFTANAAPHFTLGAWVFGHDNTSAARRAKIKLNDGTADVGEMIRQAVSSTAARQQMGLTHSIETYTAGSRTQELLRAVENGADTVTVAAGSGIVTLDLGGLT